jgi:hypothetical protein
LKDWKISIHDAFIRAICVFDLHCTTIGCPCGSGCFPYQKSYQVEIITMAFMQNNAHAINIEQHEPKQKPGVNSCSRVILVINWCHKRGKHQFVITKNRRRGHLRSQPSLICVVLCRQLFIHLSFSIDKCLVWPWNYYMYAHWTMNNVNKISVP